jgi:hypothetical protein
MKRGWKMLVCMAAGLALSASARAATTDSRDKPYDVIPVRNLFALKELPKPVQPPPPVQPTNDIKLQGINFILGRWQVLFKVRFPPPRGEMSFVMKEGEGQDEIEVLEINGKARSVTFKNNGIEQVLTMERNASTPSAPAGAPPNPGVVSLLPPAGALPTAPPTAPPGVTTARTIPAPERPVRAVSTPAPVVASYGNVSAPAPTTINLGGRELPVGTPVVQTPTPPRVQSQMTAEEQIIIMEANRELTKKEVLAGQMPPLPPTELTPEGAPGMPGVRLGPPAPPAQ